MNTGASVVDAAAAAAAAASAAVVVAHHDRPSFSKRTRLGGQSKMRNLRDKRQRQRLYQLRHCPSTGSSDAHAHALVHDGWKCFQKKRCGFSDRSRAWSDETNQKHPLHPDPHFNPSSSTTCFFFYYSSNPLFLLFFFSLSLPSSLHPCIHLFIDSSIHSFIHSGHFYSAPSSPLLLRGAPCPSVHSPIGLVIHISIYSSMLPSVHLSNHAYIYLSIRADFHQSIHPSLGLFIHLSIQPSAHLSIHLYIYLFIHLFIHFSMITHLFVHRSIQSSIHLTIYPSFNQSSHPCIIQSSTDLFIHPSTCPYIRPPPVHSTAHPLIKCFRIRLRQAYYALNTIEIDDCQLVTIYI